MGMTAWNGWYHLMSNTHGTWLPGDPRGFRARHHREHMDGDYKAPPPPGRYATRHRKSQQAMQRPAVHLPNDACRTAVEAIRHALVDVHSIEVPAIAVNAVHLHLLGRFPAMPRPTGRARSAIDDPPRHHLGIAKQWSAKTLAAKGLVAPGGVWARRGKVVAITDRPHQVKVYHYIMDHIEQGAAVWDFRSGVVRMQGD